MSSLTPSAASVTIGTTAGWTLVINGLGASAHWAELQNGVQVSSGIITSAGTYTSLGSMALYTDTTMSVLIYNSDASTTPLTSTITIAASGGSGYFEAIYDYVAPTLGANKRKLYSPGLFNDTTGVYGTGTYPINFSVVDGGGRIPYYTTFNLSGGTSPIIVGDIAGTSVVNVGDTLTLTVTVTGSTPMTYTWYENATPTVSGDTGLSSTLTKTNRQLTDDGTTYYCVVHNAHAPDATSGLVTLSVPSTSRMWPVTADLILGADSSSEATTTSYTYDEQGLTPAPGGEVAAYITSGLFSFVNSNEWLPVPIQSNPSQEFYVGGPGIGGVTDYVVFTFPAGSKTNPNLKIVYDISASISNINWDGLYIPGPMLYPTLYTGSVDLSIEASNDSGSTWLGVSYLANTVSGPGAGDGETSLIISKVIDISALTGTIDTGTFQVRLKAITKTVTIWQRDGGYSNFFGGNTQMDVNVYALYLEG